MMIVDKITQFLKTYEGQDGDIANGIADLDLDNEDGESRQRGKYMKQLVCHDFIRK